MSETSKFREQVEVIKKALGPDSSYDVVGEAVYSWEDGDLDLEKLKSDDFVAVVYAIGFVAGWCDTMNQTVNEVIDEVYHA